MSGTASFATVRSVALVIHGLRQQPTGFGEKPLPVCRRFAPRFRLARTRMCRFRIHPRGTLGGNALVAEVGDDGVDGVGEHEQVAGCKNNALALAAAENHAPE